jgi:hypothetical protein
VIHFSVDTKDLLRWSRYLTTIPKRTKPAIAKAMNTLGDHVVQTTALQISDKTGMTVSDVIASIVVSRASPSNLVWEMDATAVALPANPDNRNWDSRDDSIFAEGQLVKIIANDDSCDICQQAQEDSPFTIEQVRDMQAKYANYVPSKPVEGPRTNLLHPNCRCAVEPWRATRQFPVVVTQGNTTAPAEMMTASQLGSVVSDAMKVVFHTTG